MKEACWKREKHNAFLIRRKFRNMAVNFLICKKGGPWRENNWEPLLQFKRLKCRQMFRALLPKTYWCNEQQPAAVDV